MSLAFELRPDGAVLTVALNRPEQHNALTPALIHDLTDLFRGMPGRDDVRVIVLTGNGRSFCAGADLQAMRAAADFTFEENVADGLAIFDLMAAVDGCPQPVVARVNGAAIGGGAGLVACSDIAIAVERARFAFSEVRLGILPAVISPFVLARIGGAAARELFLSGERFSAWHAYHVQLVNEVVADEAALETAVAARVALLLEAAPGAQAAAKSLLAEVGGRDHSRWRATLAERIAHHRAGDEGREGMSAFLEKRPPRWR